MDPRTPSGAAPDPYPTRIDRRSGAADRRSTPRGGRRRADVVRFAALTGMLAIAAVTIPRAQGAAGWTTSGTRIVAPSGGDFVINGLNWYGFETTSYVARGLGSVDYRIVLDQAKQYGHNTVRLPFSSELWETNPLPSASLVSACPSCAGKRARDVMALIVNYAGSIGMHVILDNHRSNAGNSAQESGLWYAGAYTERTWIQDWVAVQAWTHGIAQAQGSADTIAVDQYAADGFPIVLGFDLRNEPHTPSSDYLGGATWGTGDGIDPKIDPNPNPFAPACVAASACHDWRLAAERAADTILGEANRNQWAYPLIFVEGIGNYPQAAGTAASGPYNYYWWGGNLAGVNGNASNPGAPVVLNVGGSASALGVPAVNQLVYSAHDYGPAEYRSAWFNSATCYASRCSASSLADLWKANWAYLASPGGINPVWPGHASYPWANTGHVAATEAPVFIGEFGTGNLDTDLFTTGAGSQGQWMTSLVNFIASSYAATKTPLNDSGIPVANLNWSYWSLNGEDAYSVLAANYNGLRSAKKEYSFLCVIQQGLLAVPMGAAGGQCGSTGMLPAPDSSAPSPLPPPSPPPPTQPQPPATPTGVTAVAGNAQVQLTWAPVTGATGYHVKYATASGGPYQTAASGVTGTNFTQTPVVNGTTYFYVVSATNTGGESANSAQVSATPVAPPPPPAPSSPISVWWPTNNAMVSGTAPFKARISSLALSDYKMYWQVDGDRLNAMGDSYVDAPHKEALVDVSTWYWRGNGPYTITFVAKSSKNGKVIAQSSVAIDIAR
ncbi:MAG TPA: cellulase family glycosylhydrolase [Vicinamibacterales bacterium]|nr:cellulase family glycosylhydrolase [Vicinamibacterales bacterium]